ncbi:MAG: dihydrodipicolinate synthase family protein [Lachnospiraceae bacterium]
MEGIKYTDSNLYELERIRTRYPEMTVMFGQDESFLYSLPVGVNGAIGSTYNFMLKKFKRIWNAYHEGRLEEAEKSSMKPAELSTLCFR